ncbi:MAG: thioredoxin-dependent thiol peroxidase [Flavobacteriales bacterium]|nr:thioredoxin-dependent thiol peroxidase [Flavobacteriales bacterium]NNK80254.1 thioredoxin-dependent thiol peroxidase [Flavobacteriales bacterium]
MLLKEGDMAPDFTGVDENGKSLSLKDYKGTKLVLYFYPKDMTPGCTVQAKNLTGNLEQLKDSGYEVIGVSADSKERHCKFIEKHGIGFPLIADENKEIIRSYGVWGRKKFMGKEYDGIIRKTFLIDENGVIERVIDKVKTKSHSEQILDS